MVTGDRAPIQARRARPMPGDECFPGSCYAIQQPRAHCETLATRCARTVGLITSQAQVTSGSTPQLSKVGVRRTQTGGSPKADSGAAFVFLLTPAHRGARVISTDALRILLVSQEPSDAQERNQDNEDNPNINAHQSSPAAAWPANSSSTDGDHLFSTTC